MIKIKGKGITALLTLSLFSFLFISCAKPQVIKPDVKGNAERAHEELKKEERR